MRAQVSVWAPSAGELIFSFSHLPGTLPTALFPSLPAHPLPLFRTLFGPQPLFCKSWTLLGNPPPPESLSSSRSLRRDLTLLSGHPAYLPKVLEAACRPTPTCLCVSALNTSGSHTTMQPSAATQAKHCLVHTCEQWHANPRATYLFTTHTRL